MCVHLFTFYLWYDNRVVFPQLCVSVSWVSPLAAGHSSDPPGEEEPPGILHQERCLSARWNLPWWKPAVRYTHTQKSVYTPTDTGQLVSKFFFHEKSLKQFKPLKYWGSEQQNKHYLDIKLPRAWTARLFSCIYLMSYCTGKILNINKTQGSNPTLTVNPKAW